MPGIFPSAVIQAAIASRQKYGIPASVTLAQWACESNWGKSMSGKNNPFGIKAKPPAPCTSCMTREVIHGQVVHLPQFFADYESLTDAFEAHAKLLATFSPYAPARAKLPDAEAFARALTGVYATDPKYGDTLVSIMRSNGLKEYDTAAPVPKPVALSPSPASAKQPGPPLSRWQRFKAAFGFLGLACAVMLVVGPALAGSPYTVTPEASTSPNATLWAWVGVNVVPLIDQVLVWALGLVLLWLTPRLAKWLLVDLTEKQEEQIRQSMLTGAHEAIASAEGAADRAQVVEHTVAWAKNRQASAIAKLGLPERVLVAMAEKMVAGALTSATSPGGH